jgi:hypothetical protein
MSRLGHSLRASYATSAATVDTPSYRIQQHTRHKLPEMVNVRLKGVGF